MAIKETTCREQREFQNEYDNYLNILRDVFTVRRSFHLKQTTNQEFWLKTISKGNLDGRITVKLT